MMIDPISDMLTRIRNAQMAGQATVVMPASKVKAAIARVLEQEQFIAQSHTDPNERNAALSDLHITLKYEALSPTQKKPLIAGIDRKSKPGQRVYFKKDMIRKVKNGYGISVISTSQGIMSGKEARKKGLGGEVICEVW